MLIREGERMLIRDLKDIDTLAIAWGLPNRSAEKANEATLETARLMVAAALPSEWRVVATNFDHWNKCGFGAELPNGRRHAVKCPFPLTDDQIAQAAAMLRAWGEAVAA